jgi:hypothetical protein
MGPPFPSPAVLVRLTPSSQRMHLTDTGIVQDKWSFRTDMDRYKMLYRIDETGRSALPDR